MARGDHIQAYNKENNKNSHCIDIGRGLVISLSKGTINEIPKKIFLRNSDTEIITHKNPLPTNHAVNAASSLLGKNTIFKTSKQFVKWCKTGKFISKKLLIADPTLVKLTNDCLNNECGDTGYSLKNILHSSENYLNSANDTVIYTRISQVDNYWHKRIGHGYAMEDIECYKEMFSGNLIEKGGYQKTKNGPDAIINGKPMQYKCYESVSECMRNVFDKKSGTYKYADQTLVVPRDKHNEMLEEMSGKILKGTVPGFKASRKKTAFEMARKLVKAGKYTHSEYKEACKPLNRMSLKLDLMGGIIPSGLSSAGTIASRIIREEEIDFKGITIEGIKDGSNTLIKSVAEAQLIKGKVGIEAIKSFGKTQNGTKLFRAMRNFFSPNTNLNGQIQAMSIGIGVSVAVSSIYAFSRFISGDLKIGDLLSGMATNLSATIGGTFGSLLGNAGGYALGGLIGFATGGIGILILSYALSTLSGWCLGGVFGKITDKLLKSLRTLWSNIKVAWKAIKNLGKKIVSYVFKFVVSKVKNGIKAAFSRMKRTFKLLGNIVLFITKRCIGIYKNIYDKLAKRIKIIKTVIISIGKFVVRIGDMLIKGLKSLLF